MIGRSSLLVLLASAAVAVADGGPAPTPDTFTALADWGRLKWIPHSSKLNLQGYQAVWGDDFNSCDIGEDRTYQSHLAPDTVSSERHRWYWSNQTFHLAKFVPPSAQPSPYRCANGTLNLTLSNPTGQQWQSGIVSADGSAHRGFEQNYPYSYFEARIKLPVPSVGLMPWPAFWLLSTSATSRGSEAVLEVDVIEPGLVSPKDPTLQATTLHEWPAYNPKANEITAERSIGYNDHYVTFDGKWHTYGVLRTPDWFIIYRDGVEERRLHSIGREMRQPLYPILDLALKHPTASTGLQYTMSVDYVHVFVCTAGTICGR